MQEHRHGYKSAPHEQDAAAKLKSMDSALRAEILANARRQYETAARELWIRTRAEAHAQAKAQEQARTQSQAYAAAYARAEEMKERAQLQARQRTQTYDERHVPFKQTDKRVRYSPQPPLPSHTPSNASSAPGTPRKMIYRFRHSPKETSKSTSPSKPFDESSLKLEELKRRYYAQLIDHEPEQSPSKRPYRVAPRSRSTIGDNARLQYVHVSEPGQARTMADEYLDYYMPARRGPQPTQSYAMHQEETYKAIERNSPEEVRYQRANPRFDPYMDRAVRRNDVPEESPVQRVRDKQTYRSPAEVQLQPSKGKLAFLLNPTEYGTPQTSPRLQGLTDTLRFPNPHPSRRDADVEIRASSSDSRRRPSYSAEPYPRHSYDDSPALEHRSCVNDGKPSASQEASSSRNAERDRTEYRASPSHPSDTHKRDVQRNKIVRASYSRPAKRKATLSPESPGQSDSSSEEEAPRAKRRAFGRLPTEFDSQSEHSHDEKEKDASVEMLESNDENATPDKTTYELRSASRHNNVDYSTADKRTRQNARVSSVQRRCSRSSGNEIHTSTTSPMVSAKTDKFSPDPSGGLKTEDEVAASHSSSSSAPGESKKYDFRPRSKQTLG